MALRVLIIDDSSTMRAILRHVFAQDPEIEVVGEAADPYEAREAVKRLNPDVLTLDIEMPRMDGLKFLEKIMTLRPMPVIMVSSLTTEGAEKTLQALELGAVDFVAKPAGKNIVGELAVLIPKVKAASRARVTKRVVHRPPAPPAPPAAVRPATRSANRPIIAIGASTGGVDALLRVISHFPIDCPPTLIVQHMPAEFTRSFAARLNNCTQASVQQAEDGLALRTGHIYLAPGGDRHLELDYSSDIRCVLVKGAEVSGHCPSVDILFNSVSKLRKRVVAALLTGMGSDGAQGLKQIRDAGGLTLGQDEASSVVYGMPRIAHQIGGVMQQLPLNSIGPAILENCYADCR